MIRMLPALVLSCAVLAAPVAASEIVSAELRPGWRTADGRHIAALHLTLSQGWKTYWRSPGDAGIPPVFDWSGSRNAAQVRVDWPTPEVSWQGGMRSIVYHDEVVLPLTVTTQGAGDIALKGEMDLGLCKDICLPHHLSFSAVLPAQATKPDPMIAAALASMPYSAAEAAVRDVRCDVSLEADGIGLRAEIEMPSAGGEEQTVVEVGNPLIWVAEPASRRNGARLVTQTMLRHVEGSAFALDRSTVRITVLGKQHAVDIQGCR